MANKLRPYQEEAIKAVEAALTRGVTHQMVVMATGCGKTKTAVSVSEKYKRVLWITHTEDLIKQSALAFIKEKYDETIVNHIDNVGFIDYVRNGGMFAGGSFKMGLVKADAFFPHGNVVMASIQTLWRRLDRFKPEEFDLIVIDEAHLAASKTFRTTIEYFKPKLCLLLTATPHREDNLLLSDVCDEIVYDFGIKEGIDGKYLCELDAVRVKTTTSLDNVRTTGGELNQKDLSEEIDNPQRNQLVVSAYLKYAKGRQAIFYCVDVKHAVSLAQVFNDLGVKCKAVSSNEQLTPDRSQTIKDFKDEKLMVLTNCMILTTGVDIPNVGCIGMSSPTKSLTKYLQCVGRGTRLKNDKYVGLFGQNTIILDYIDSTSRHNLVNAWELDKLKEPEDRVFITEEKREKLLEERRKKKLNIAERKEDERVKLLRIPRPKLRYTKRTKEPATPAQLKWIADLGYDVNNQTYTKEMVSKIIMDLPATPKQRGLLKYYGYDVDSVIVLTRGMMDAAMIDYEKRKPKTITK